MRRDEPNADENAEALALLLEMRILAGCTACGRRFIEDAAPRIDIVLVRFHASDVDFPYCAACAAKYWVGVRRP